MSVSYIKESAQKILDGFRAYYNFVRTTKPFKEERQQKKQT